MTRIGILTIQDQRWSTIVDEWRWLEELGLDSLWTADHFVSPLDAGSDWFEGWTLLAALATATTRVRIGTLVSSMTLRTPPLMVRQAVTVDHVSGGRMELGIGSGRVVNDHLMTGVPEWTPGERIRRFAEWAELTRLLLDQTPVTYEGEFYRCEGAVMLPRPVQGSIPLVIGAVGPRMIEIAARFADIWNTLGNRDGSSEQAYEDTRRRVEHFGQSCVSAGRDPADVRRSFLAFSAYIPDEPWASEQAFVDFVGRYADLGFDEIIFDAPSAVIRRQFEHIISAQLSEVQASP